MVGEDVDGNLKNRLSYPESSLSNINTIWDLRRLLKSSQERLEDLEKTSAPESKSIQLERAIIRGASKEIKRLEREALFPDVFHQ
jgi:hypothetical protein